MFWLGYLSVKNYLFVKHKCFIECYFVDTTERVEARIPKDITSPRKNSYTCVVQLKPTFKRNYTYDPILHNIEVL